MRRALVIVAAVLVVAAAACSSSSSEPAVGVSGDRPTSEVAEPATTTTIEPTTTTTLPTQVVEIPDVSGLGISWDTPLTVNAATGAIDVNQFNTFLVNEAPTGITGEESVAVFLGLDADDTDAQMLVTDGGFGKKTITVVVAGADDSVRATRYSFSTEVRERDFAQEAAEDVELAEDGLDGEAAEGAGGDTESVAEDDLSTAEEIETPASEGEEADPEPVAFLISGHQTTQCQPDRGHQDFIVGLCL